MNAPLPFSARPVRYLTEAAGWCVKPHPHHARLYHLEIEPALLQQFMAATTEIDPQRLEYVPYMRFILAQKLDELLGRAFRTQLRNILQDRESGGFTLGLSGTTTLPAEFVKFGTAIAYLLGVANFDSMSGTYYARFTVKDTDTSDSYLRQAYRLFTLHTDGTFVDEPTDWLLMMKFAELHARGGESRILHLDDWEDLGTFSTHAFASHAFTYKAPSSKNVGQTIQRQTFFQHNNRPCICFIDQFVYPQTVAEAQWLQALSDSMEASAGTVALPLPVGDLIVLNNLFWLHGRAPFEKDPGLHRELMRIRGEFAEDAA
ncbi:glutarate dioxygenase GlaH [Silvimonas iriomotensis]|uniref:Protein CsiD n=1 Tax=Silvimonas iriomotensis TaxID=449662 RepID=A0ABQ2P481_9NEIS|nr:glutarate dioxygenase GlaH [Silvimonas iriomotensis]GGP17833.1 protein CsiD [Silvimonas iriomotensis]